MCGMLARLVVFAASLVALLTVGVAQATACEKHLNGHGNSAETTGEVQGR
jgi:AhpD family alkylhydroperoxidase